ncbi:hypothetical protein NQ317_009331 [Molorchus minor]|uniref:Protein KRI1 homolog n=1 Tax=Molorchus minor TaxID=1323400 RepID=A0ABQ9JGH2_9CUCU|nr:hypothetical protein NQ317_009331 [Molorchus minor]
MLLSRVSLRTHPGLIRELSVTKNGHARLFSRFRDLHILLNGCRTRILLANERELNRWCSLKKAVQIRPDHVEKYEQIAYKKKAQNIVLKNKILPSLFSDTPEDVEISSKKKNNRQVVNNNEESINKDGNSSLNEKLGDKDDKGNNILEGNTNNEDKASKSKSKKKKKVKRALSQPNCNKKKVGENIAFNEEKGNKATAEGSTHKKSKKKKKGKKVISKSGQNDTDLWSQALVITDTGLLPIM